MIGSAYCSLLFWAGSSLEEAIIGFPFTSLVPAHAPFRETDIPHLAGLVADPSLEATQDTLRKSTSAAFGAVHSSVTIAAPLSISRAPFGFAMAPTGSAPPLLYPPLSTPWGSVSGFSQFAPGIFPISFY